MRILVTGASGFIGSRIIRELSLNGDYRLSATGRNFKNLNILPDNVFKIPGNVIDEDFCKLVTREIDVVIHCAGLAGTWGTYETYYLANVLATKNLVTALKANGGRRFINISSPSIYFDFKDQLNLTETFVPRRFANAYAQTKWEAEQLLQKFHSEDFQTVSLRPRSVIGRGDQNIIPRLLTLEQRSQLVQLGNGENLVDITTVGNLIDAIKLTLLAHPNAMGTLYNITNGLSLRFWDFVEEVMAEAGFKWRKRRAPYFLVAMAARLNEIYHQIKRTEKEPSLLPVPVGILRYSMTLDISKAKTQLGYRPRLSTSDGIKEFFSQD